MVKIRILLICGAKQKHTNSIKSGQSNSKKEEEIGGWSAWNLASRKKACKPEIQTHKLCSIESDGKSIWLKRNKKSIKIKLW